MEKSETGSTIKTYETIVICDLDNYNDSIETLSEMCQEYTGTKFKITVDRQGAKKLAYPIKETHIMGYYAIFTWRGTTENVTELERQMRIDENVLKFMTIRVDEEEYELQEFAAIEESEQDVSQDAWDKIFN